jgi:hypothetical protein
MARESFYVTARWDAEAGVFVSESNIKGLHIETASLQTFEEVMFDAAPELILSNHVSDADFAKIPLKDLLPHWVWRPPVLERA